MMSGRAALLISSCSMLRDICYLGDKLGKAEGFGDFGEALLKIIEDKEI